MLTVALGVAAVSLIGLPSAADAAVARPDTEIQQITLPKAECDAIKQAEPALPSNDACKATLVVETSAVTTIAPATAAGAPTATGYTAAKAAKWTRKSYQVRWCWGEHKPKLGGHGGFNCNFLAVWLKAVVIYNGKRVWNQGYSCDDKGVYNIQKTWCGFTNNGSKKISFGVNFRTHLGIGDANVSRPYWMRIWITNKGVATTGGAPA
ncbi:hypothetical protein ACFFWC_23415 [Plantactinospora siamensis]|uniref:Secreted protein n=1 Tax=Plantactinospora siamensis TaxID=555372 RepID=A0ABV6NUG2_9ACTN